MGNYLIVVDMQQDFINGSLGTAEAEQIVPKVQQKISDFDGTILFTRDTHQENYLSTREGKFLPVEHCIKPQEGWQIDSRLNELAETKATRIFDKPTFGSVELAQYLVAENEKEPISSIEVIGLCTDICVVSNALLIKAFLPETDLIVDASCCAGVTPRKHQAALETMESCQIIIKNEAV